MLTCANARRHLNSNSRGGFLGRYVIEKALRIVAVLGCVSKSTKWCRPPALRAAT
jgi:hypothetical protein